MVTVAKSLTQHPTTESSIPFGAWAEAKRKATTGGLLTHQLRTKCARQGFILFTHMLVVSPVPKRDRNNPLRRVFSCLQYVNCVLVLAGQLRKGCAMNIKLNPMPATPFEAVHAAADVMSWLGFTNYVKHGHECRIDVMEHCDLQVVVDYANSQVVIVGFLDGMEI